MAPLTLLALFSASFVFLSKAQEDEGSIPESIELTVKFGKCKCIRLCQSCRLLHELAS